jgi:hypothetical protein
MQPLLKPFDQHNADRFEGMFTDNCSGDQKVSGWPSHNYGDRAKQGV